jgi:hypothetical protein
VPSVASALRDKLRYVTQRNVAGHVFISYVREDSDRVGQLHGALQAAGIPVWRDTADLWPGEDWRLKIRRAITDNALVFIACFSLAALARGKCYQNEELALAIEQLRLRQPDDPWLIPVRLDECDIPDRDIGSGRTLTSLQRADLFGDRFDDGATRLIAAIRRILGGSSAADPLPEGNRRGAAPPIAVGGRWPEAGRARAGNGITAIPLTGLQPNARRRPYSVKDDARSSKAAPRPGSGRYQLSVPSTVMSAFFMSAKTPLAGREPLYRDVAGNASVGWELLAACDWMQCRADSRYSPVCGEKLGTVNADGTVYQTKSAALTQCASDLVFLTKAVHEIDLTARRPFSVQELASAFGAFRWGGLLKANHVSAMEFPYSVGGLTSAHMKMRWPVIEGDDAPDKPGSRFRMPFGAVPLILMLGYSATVD